jgi:vacuolar-type H+-ATPase subunit I/STV1
MEFSTFVLRKLIATFVATIISAALLSLFYNGGNPEILYNQGEQFIGMFLFMSFYVGIIVLIYGNLVSISVELLQRKWFQQYDWVYVLIVSAFGFIVGIYGMISALLYAVLDKWLYKRMINGQGIKRFFVVPITSILVLWSYFHFTSPQMPPFTKEEAVEFATSGEGTPIELFPKKVGKWNGIIDGYTVERETTVHKIGEEVYMVTFSEKWGNETETGAWTLSYEVERGRLMAHGETGKTPPYYNE